MEIPRKHLPSGDFIFQEAQLPVCYSLMCGVF